MTAVQRISDERIAEIMRLLGEHGDRHRAHEIGCGCSAYQDLICYLPEYDPEDPRNTAIPEQVDEYVLTDGTVLDGDRQGWRVSRRLSVPARPVIIRAEQTCFACPAQWDAWDADGSQYYLRYRHSFGSAERVRRGEGEWLDGDRREPVGEFETDETDGGVISLEEFCERAGLELRLA